MSPVYAVHRGHHVGVFATWPECQAATRGYHGAVWRKCGSHDEATAFVTEGVPRAPPRTIYADGSCDLANQAAGAGVFFGTDDDPRNQSAAVPGTQTNQRAELWALLLALRALRVDDVLHTVVTDSRYAIRVTTRACAAHTNLDLVHDLWKEVARVGHLVTFQHVHGHQGLYGNERADALAKQAMRRCRQARTEAEAKAEADVED